MKFLFYLIPSMFDYVLYGIFFIAGYRLAESGASALLASMPMAVWGIIYSLSSPVIGRMTTVKNARYLVFFSGLGTALISVLFIVFHQIWMQFVLIAAMGIIAACYCTPFQICAGNSGKNSSPARAAALYTFSWSIGTAIGTFGFGCLPAAAAFTVNALIGLSMSWVIFAGRHPEKEKEEITIEEKKEEVPNRMVSVWIFSGCAAFCMGIAGALLPVYGAELKYGVFMSSAFLAALRFVQGITALILIRFGKRMFGRGVFLMEMLAGVLGMLCWCFGKGEFFLFAGSVLFGICGGFFYFSFVFHALSHPEKSGTYIGINELVQGLAGIAGPLAGGAGAQHFGCPLVFGGLAVLLLICGVISAGIIRTDIKKCIVQ